MARRDGALFSSLRSLGFPCFFFSVSSSFSVCFLIQELPVLLPLCFRILFYTSRSSLPPPSQAAVLACFSALPCACVCHALRLLPDLSHSSFSGFDCGVLFPSLPSIAYRGAMLPDCSVGTICEQPLLPCRPSWGKRVRKGVEKGKRTAKNG